VEFVDVSTTSAAAERCANQPDSAAVAGRAASESYGIPILRERIEDNLHNRTRFLVVGFNEPARSGRDKTSVLMGLEHKAGSLHRALGALERHGMNLMMIQSRPTKQRPWEYLFFIDMQGFVTDKPVASALADLQSSCLFVRVLGSYPEAD
jgi:chorismate mutase/prephenate dehydratase